MALGEKEVLGVRLRLPQGEGENVALPHADSVGEMEGEPEMELVMVSVPVTAPLALGERVADSVPLWQLLPLLEYVALGV